MAGSGSAVEVADARGVVAGRHEGEVAPDLVSHGLILVVDHRLEQLAVDVADDHRRQLALRRPPSAGRLPAPGESGDVTKPTPVDHISIPA
jgi:hypothetical protein